MPTTRQGLRQLATAEAGRGRAKPRLATWLTPWLVGGIVLVASISLADAHRQRRPMLAAHVEEQLALLSSILSITVDDLVSQERTAALDELLAAALDANNVFAAFVLGTAGNVVAGGSADVSCLPGELPLRLPRHAVSGRVKCDRRLYWSATPLQAGNWLVVGIDDELASRAEQSAFRRQLLLLLGAAATAVLALTMVLRRYMIALADPDRRAAPSAEAS